MSRDAINLQTDSRHRSDVVAFARSRLGFEPDPDQARALDPFIRRGPLTVVASPSARQSAEFVRKVAGFPAQLEIPARGDGDKDILLALPNGSRIVGLPGREDTIIRGFSRCLAPAGRRGVPRARRAISGAPPHDRRQPERHHLAHLRAQGPRRLLS